MEETAAESVPTRRFSRRWPRPLLAIVPAVLLVAGLTVAVVGWVRAADEVEELTAEVAKAKTEAEESAASRETIADQLVEFRLAHDPDVAAATAELQRRAEVRVCDDATAATRAGNAPAVAPDTAVHEALASASEFPVLGEVPGWEAHLDVAAVAAARDGCVQATQVAMEEEHRAAERAAARSRNSGTYVGGEDWSKYLCENNGGGDGCIGMEDIRNAQRAKRGDCPEGFTCDSKGNIVGG